MCDSEGNPGSVSQCLIVSVSSCESLLRICHRVYSEKLRLGLCECEGAIKKKTGSSEMLFSQISIEQGSPDAEGSLYGHKAK